MLTYILFSFSSYFFNVSAFVFAVSDRYGSNGASFHCWSVFRFRSLRVHCLCLEQNGERPPIHFAVVMRRRHILGPRRKCHTPLGTTMTTVHSLTRSKLWFATLCTSDFVSASESCKKPRPATKSDPTESISSNRAAPRSRRERSVESSCTTILMDLVQIDEI